MGQINVRGTHIFGFLRKCHCIQFQENENIKKLYLVFVFKSYLLFLY